MGYQIIDALDTFLVLGLEEEYGRAAEWVRENVAWDKGGEYNTFEVSPGGGGRGGEDVNVNSGSWKGKDGSWMTDHG